MKALAIVQLPSDRLIHVALAIHLFPALFAVLVVGALGVVILAFYGLFAPVIRREACRLRELAGLEGFRS